MADAATKHLPILTDITSLLKTRRSVAFIYGFMFAFVTFTVVLAFNPSSNTYAPWFSNIFSVKPSSNANSASDFESIFSYIFPTHNSSFPASNFTDFAAQNDAGNVTGPGSADNSTIVDQQPTGMVANSTQTQVKFTKGKTLDSKQTGSRVDSTQKQGNLVKAETLESNQTGSAVNSTQSQQNLVKAETLRSNQTGSGVNSAENEQNLVKVEDLESNQTGSGVNGTEKQKNLVKVESLRPNQTEIATPGSQLKSNNTDSLPKKPEEEKKKKGFGVESLLNCELFDGEWVKDESYPLYKPGSCSVIDEQFNCITNGRPDKEYHKYKWKPRGCNLPRLNAGRMLNLLRGKRLVFVGDSLNRNMWESLVCILKSAVKDRKKVYEASGRQHFRGEASYSFIFKDYNCTVEFYVTPFLVQEWEVVDKNGSNKETLRLDLVGKSSDQYKGADFIVFNTGHWWTHDKTSKGEDYYQEGSHIYKELNVLEAFRKALTTWSRWVDSNVNPAKSMVFFRGYSASHFSGGQWNSGGACDHEVEPINNPKYLKPYPSKMIVLEKVLKGMKTNVKYLNVTQMTDYRKDGHPSMYRKHDMSRKDSILQLHIQDCSHWCLPGVPDTWNEILYAELLINEFQKQRVQKRHR